MIIHGDALEELKKLKDNSVDSVVTDPPYGLSKEPDIVEVLTKWINGEPYDHRHGGFMGKKWDSFVPHPDLWKEVYRVLKPGGHALVFAGTRTQDLMTIALRLAGFEVRDVIEWLYFCLSDDTQALTREGWKSYKELTEYDHVMQWDSETGEMSWVVPEAIHVFPYEGKMLNFKSASTDQLVTPNHRMYVDVKKHSRNEYAGKYEVFEARELKRHWFKKFPLAGSYKGNKSVGTNRAKLLGWFLTDAWVHADGKAVMFSQSKPDTLVKLREVLDNASVTYSEYTKEPKKDTHNVEHTFYVTGKDADWLLDNYGNRRFNDHLLDLVIDERKALLESLIDGDGSRSKEGLLTFWSKDEGFRNFVRQLMFTLDMRTSVDPKKGCVRGSTRFSSTELQYKHGVHEVDYAGEVWCVTVPKGAFVVKRNDHVFITGNSGFPKSYNISKAFDRKAGAKREVVGKNPNHRPVSGVLYEGIYAGSNTGAKNITAPATDLAKQWEGWGTTLKPAHEPIIMVRKPLEVDGKKATIIDNVREHGTGGLNVDECRVEGEVTTFPKVRNDYKTQRNQYGDFKGQKEVDNPKEGRFPSNCITLEDDQFFSKYFNISPQELSKKTSKKDRNSDWEGVEINVGERNNIHPTVKPVNLMAWLVRLITPPNGTVLDPFAGSGSTLVAAKREGFNYIGIEITDEYIPIIEARLKD